MTLSLYQVTTGLGCPVILQGKTTVLVVSSATSSGPDTNVGATVVEGGGRGEEGEGRGGKGREWEGRGKERKMGAEEEERPTSPSLDSIVRNSQSTKSSGVRVVSGCPLR